MSEDRDNRSELNGTVGRRGFLRGVTAAAGAAGLAPGLVATVPIMAASQATAMEAALPTLPPYTARLAEYAAALRYEDIPADVLQRSKDCIADAVGVMLFGSRFSWSRTVIAYARTGTTGKPGDITAFLLEPTFPGFAIGRAETRSTTTRGTR